MISMLTRAGYLAVLMGLVVGFGPSDGHSDAAVSSRDVHPDAGENSSNTDSDAGEDSGDVGNNDAEDSGDPDGDDTDDSPEAEESDDRSTDEKPGLKQGDSVLPSFSMPQLDLPTGKLPGMEGLKAPTVERSDMPERKRSRATEFTVRSIQHAHGHHATGRGCAPSGRLEGFRVELFPSQIQPFTTCVRLSADGAAFARLEARILDPGGREVADASGEVSFEARGKPVDYVIEWIGFPVRRKGTYEMVLQMDRREIGRFELEVSEE